MFAFIVKTQEESPDIEVGISALKRSQDFVKRRNLMLLSVAYAASIGGTGVITGTPSNLIILEVCLLIYIEFIHGNVNTSFELWVLGIATGIRSEFCHLDVIHDSAYDCQLVPGLDLVVTNASLDE